MSCGEYQHVNGVHSWVDYLATVRVVKEGRHEVPH